MKTDLTQFLIYYILFRKHSSLVSEIWVKTPFQALEYWYKISPELFIENPLDFKKKLLIMKKNL
jgi:hypothetical protein